MNLAYKDLLPVDFPPQSRVWIYQSSRVFSIAEALAIEEDLNAFVKQWNTHGKPVKGAAFLFFGQFIILMADEAVTPVSGCSTDSSVRVIKAIEQNYKTGLFDRLNLAFVVKDKIELLPYAQVQYAINNGLISPSTLFFNNNVQNKEELENNWIIPLEKSWLYSRVMTK